MLSVQRIGGCRDLRAVDQAARAHPRMAIRGLGSYETKLARHSAGVKLARLQVISLNGDQGDCRFEALTVPLITSLG